MKRLIAFLIRRIIALRYRVRIEGLEHLRGLRGALILPNHPALMDPIIVVSHLWRHARPRPVASERFVEAPFFGRFIRITGAFPMPDLYMNAGESVKARVNAAMENAGKALERGDNILFYPAGRLCESGLERIRGTGLRRLLDERPESPLVLIRTRGLRGSMFSVSLKGTVPDLAACVIRGAFIVIRNLIFFTPRRTVTVHIEPAPSECAAMDNAALNAYLESWYNAPGEEPISLVSYSFLRKSYPKVAAAPAAVTPGGGFTHASLVKAVQAISAVMGIEPARITPEARLGDDLGMDSLALSETVLQLKEVTGPGGLELAGIVTVADLAAAIEKGGGLAPEDLEPAPLEWTRPVPRSALTLPLAETVLEAFVRSAAGRRDEIAAADPVSGILTYQRLLLAIIILAKKFRSIRGTHVGLMLPASAGCSLAYLALLAAGKIPVMVNWTAGRRNVTYALDLAQVTTVVTSKTFIDRVDDDLSWMQDRLLYIETVRAGVSLPSKIAGLLKSKLPAGVILSGLRHNRDPHSPAVLLYTSGSEAAPKGVPLSHANIITDIRGCVPVLGVRTDDVLYSFLPPFHSFGLTATTLLPLLCGVRMVYHPNPNESARIAAGCAKWGITIIAGTPTFLRRILLAGESENFLRMHLAVSGAEKAPDSLFALGREKLPAAAHLLEGYGITECSPVVSVNIPGEPRCGVGRVIDGARVMIASEADYAPLPEGERGMILVSGPIVFGGYFRDERNPFVEINGERWYNTGDIGYLDGGCIVVSGRLKRFVKIAGEMVNLTAIEDALKSVWPDAEQGPVIAVAARENGDGAEVVLAATIPADVQQANETLSAAGFPLLWKVKRVQRVEAIPLLGSGKLDLKALGDLVQSSSS